MSSTPGDTLEALRVAEGAPWRTWGPYLSERQWGTVREDYSADGSAWDYFPHDHARSRAYRWGEDGILGISDDSQLLCFAPVLWNHADPILKERLFGLTNDQGNHGEDVKELYYFLDNTPSHSYMKGLYKYPQRPYPYEELIEVNRSRNQLQREYEITDSEAFSDSRYFDVVVEYAKDAPTDVYVRVSVTNHGPEPAQLTLLGQLWFRNRWSWNARHANPNLEIQPDGVVLAEHARLGKYFFRAQDGADFLFTENNTNTERLDGTPNQTPYVKDAFHRYLVNGEETAVNPTQVGTKCAAVYRLTIQPSETASVYFRLSQEGRSINIDFAEDLFRKRQEEADEFYEALTPCLAPEVANVQRQAFASLLWSKQYYHLGVRDWLEGDPLQPPPPESRKHGRNCMWTHFDAAEVLAMPDTWEYPWFASWDLAFHCLTYALIDPQFAKDQLVLLCREWYMHPNGQMPAYEWSFSDVNPPVHAWAAWGVYTIERRATGKSDRTFLARVFHKLLLNFTWWVNRKDGEGNNVFEGGFLGLDNIGVFDRNQVLGADIKLEQADATSWMGMFCLDMLTIALELAEQDPAYEDMAVKFFEHFLYIGNAMNNMGASNMELWDEQDGFYYDVLNRPGGTSQYIRARSWVGLIPLFAATTLEPDVIDKYPGFKTSINWFLANRPEYLSNIASVFKSGRGERRLLSLVPPERLRRVMSRLMDESEFLSDFGIRALSRYHKDHPCVVNLNDKTYSVDYEPAESTSGTFGGNSNWRGPIWFPLNYLMIEALQNLDYYYQDLTLDLPKSVCPNGASLDEVSRELERRLISIFLPDASGHRPCLRDAGPYDVPTWQSLVLFHEYFDGDTGRGLGASHQAGWTALIAKIIQQYYYTHAPDRGDQQQA